MLSRLLNTILLFICWNSVVHAQNFEWLKTYGTKNSWDRIKDVASLGKGESIFMLEIDGINKTDSLMLGSRKIIVDKPHKMILVKVDSAGNVLKVRLLGSELNSAQMCADGNGDIYIIATIESIGFEFDSITLNANKGCLVFAKYDKDLNRIWINQMGKGLAVRELFFSQGHILFTSTCSDTVILGTKKYIFNNYMNSLFGEITSSSGNLKWFNNIVVNGNFNTLELGGIEFLKGHFYLAANCDGVVHTSKDTLRNGFFILMLDSIGGYITNFLFPRNNFNYLAIPSLTTDGEFLYFGGYFTDSIIWDGKIIKTQYPNPYYNQEFYLASLTSELKARWFYRPKVLNFSRNTGGISNMVTNEGYLFLCGISTTTLLFDSTILNKTGKNNDAMILKMDYLGNVLWAVGANTGFAPIDDISAFAGKSIHIAGYFSDSIKFGRFKDSAKGLYNAWITKLSDNSIFRGNIYKGPYCAGDSVKVPFAKEGIFDSSNYFIAELSDKDGNFQNGGRELGRIKSNKSGVVNGKLPLFQVATSGNYRIRIRSTRPAIQSFYRIDTLRLLIYSKDKADPGPPETICKGDTLQLNTYGGTQWDWNPKYNLSDTDIRQPRVWPIKDTVYTIIITDSSGCGMPDTAFKKVFVRQDPKIHLSFYDTFICDTGIVLIPFYFSGGDSNYKYQWYKIKSPKSWIASISGEKVYRDTLVYRAIDSMDNIVIVLKDGCASKSDTAFVTIIHKKPFILKKAYKDTSVCVGHFLKYKTMVPSGSSKYATYQWKDLITNTVLSRNDSLNFISTKTLKIQLIVHDGCENFGDTIEFDVIVKPFLKAISNIRDTTICYGEKVKYTIKATGGNDKAYSFSWIFNNKEIATTDYLLLTTDHYTSTSNLILVLKDGCTIPNDTIKKIITIIPKPKADFNWDITCNKTKTNFAYTGTKPSMVSFVWNFNNESPSYLENPSYLFSVAGIKKVGLIVNSSNGCSDTMTKDVEIKVQSKAEFKVKDVCESDSVVFTNLSIDATGYSWKFGDGNTSKIENPKHRYQITSTTTYNVTLVALVENGCSDSVVNAVTVNQNPNSDFTAIQTGDKLELKAKAGYTKYKWEIENEDSISTTNPNYTYDLKKYTPHKIRLTVTDAASCNAQTCKTITLGISKILKPYGFNIYPNPNSGNFTVEIENPEKDVTIEVFDLVGNLIECIETDSSKKTYSIDLKVAKGIYLVRVKNGGMAWNQRVVLE